MRPLIAFWLAAIRDRRPSAPEPNPLQPFDGLIQEAFPGNTGHQSIPPVTDIQTMTDRDFRPTSEILDSISRPDHSASSGCGGPAASSWSGLGCQIRSVLSRPHERIRRPSGLNCIFQTQLVCPFNVNSPRPRSVPQILILA